MRSCSSDPDGSSRIGGSASGSASSDGGGPPSPADAVAMVSASAALELASWCASVACSARDADEAAWLAARASMLTGGPRLIASVPCAVSYAPLASGGWCVGVGTPWGLALEASVGMLVATVATADGGFVLALCDGADGDGTEEGA